MSWTAVGELLRPPWPGSLRQTAIMPGEEVAVPSSRSRTP